MNLPYGGVIGLSKASIINLYRRCCSRAVIVNILDLAPRKNRVERPV